MLGVTFHSVGQVSLPTFSQIDLQYWIEIGTLISQDLSLQYQVQRHLNLQNRQNLHDVNLKC
jgi:hypothetical protein